MTRTDDNLQPFSALGPDEILRALESAGFEPDGRLLELNSYENRVWQVGLEHAEPVVAKFYRPGRWSNSAIGEEHAFTRELAETGLSVVAPVAIDGATLLEFEDFRFAVFPRRGGHAPEFDHEPTLRHLGRVLGRMHAVGSSASFAHRPRLDPRERGRASVDWLLAEGWVPTHLEKAFSSLCDDLITAIEAGWSRAGTVATIRLHGDCHPGNILWRDEQAHFVDLDDCMTGPAVQDLWMLIAGERADRERQIDWLIEEYRTFADFDARQLHLIEPLRALRMIHYQYWLARRWHDPAFPRAFPWFADDRHWEGVIQQLREQAAELQEPPLALGW